MSRANSAGLVNGSRFCLKADSSVHCAESMLSWLWVCCTERPPADMVVLLVVVIDAGVAARRSSLHSPHGKITAFKILQAVCIVCMSEQEPTCP